MPAIIYFFVQATGLLMIIISILFFISEKRLKETCTEKTTGKVIRYKYMGSRNKRTISPVVIYSIDNKTYESYRHYKGIKYKYKSIPNKDKNQSKNNVFYISDTDFFCVNKEGPYINYKKQAEKYWPINKELTVLYNKKNPRKSFVEKVVTTKKIAGITLLSAGILFIILPIIMNFLLNL